MTSTPRKIIANDRRLNDQRFPRPEDTERGEGGGDGRGSADPAYGAGANGHDTACAIKERREYITILILLYTTFLRHIYADTKVEQAKMKKIRSFRIIILLVVVYHSAVA